MWRVVAGNGEHRVLPDAVMDLMVHRGRFVVAGADTAAWNDDESEPGDVTWGLRLPPGTACSVLGLPAHELTDQRVDLADLVTVPAPALDTAWLDASTALEQVFVALWRQAAPDASTLRLAASLDRAARGRTTVREVADRHGLSERSLRRASDRLFGYGLKTLMSIHRFQHALGLANTGVALGEAAATAGYADQAHLNREMRRLTGTTPTALLR
ncbi:helix-turn-helix transcriptional regulator [Amycolatopsis minnesotensis]|uniref:Helix-turn-helix transcriptional regulator n=2 Tax=Amycolatopsis minnesotensis TaxID=337894 RepID=A0ABN2QZY8_9PSEU